MSVLALPESHPGFLYGIPRGESALQVVVVLHRGVERSQVRFHGTAFLRIEWQARLDRVESRRGIGRVIGDTLRELGVDAAGAEPWARGLVGLGLATGEWWLERRTMTRAAVAGYLTAFVWQALSGIARSYGVALDSGPLRLVDDEEAGGG